MSLRETYTKEMVPRLLTELQLKNRNAVPAIRSVVLNVGLGDTSKDAKRLEVAEQTLRRITGQAPVKTRARKSIAAFKIRQGMVIGLKVTLRGKRMWDFVEKLVRVTFPRIRDFRGIAPTGFDEHGNYSIGFREHIAFPEIRADEIEALHGLQVTLQTSAKNRQQGLALLTALGFPFKNESSSR